MRQYTRDPISGRKVTVLDGTLYLVEGDGPQAIKIYFESETNRMKYLALTTGGPQFRLSRRINEGPGSAQPM